MLRKFPVTAAGGVYHTLKRLIAIANISPHVTFNSRGRFANMAPLSNRPWCMRLFSSSLAFLTLLYLPSPLSKSPLSAFPATSSRGEVSLIKQRRRSSPSSPISCSLTLTLFTAIKLPKRQLLHSVSALLQSRVLPLPRSATTTVDLACSSLFFPEKLRELWIIPIFFLLVTGVSLGVAWLLGNLLRLRPSQRYLRSCLSRRTLTLLAETLQWPLPHS